MSKQQDDSQRSKARGKLKKRSQKKHNANNNNNVKLNQSGRAKKKKQESTKRKSGHGKVSPAMRESIREQKLRTIRHSCASTTSENKTDRSTPKNVTINQPREVDDDEVNKLVEKYKTKKDYAIVPKTNIKKYIQLDQRVKSKATVPILNQKNQKTKAKKSKDEVVLNEEKDNDGTTSTTPTSKTPSRTVSVRTPVESPAVVKEVEEDRYDTYPKIDEILKLPPEDIYGGEVNPSWMVYLEPFDEDMKDVETPIAVGSEQIEMYHAKKFKLHVPPEQKLVLDQWENSAVLISRNELFFTVPLVFSNTIRSLINVASAKTEKKEKAALHSKPDEKPVSIEVIELDRAKCYIYTRANPIVSVAEKNFMKPEDIPCVEDLSMHASKFKKQ